MSWLFLKGHEYAYCDLLSYYLSLGTQVQRYVICTPAHLIMPTAMNNPKVRYLAENRRAFSRSSSTMQKDPRLSTRQLSNIPCVLRDIGPCHVYDVVSIIDAVISSLPPTLALLQRRGFITDSKYRRPVRTNGYIGCLSSSRLNTAYIPSCLFRYSWSCSRKCSESSPSLFPLMPHFMQLTITKVQQQVP